MDELDSLEGTGTMIIISNLRKVGHQLELQVNDEECDITITSFAENETYQQIRTGQASSTRVPLDYSFRAYAAVLYKIPRMQIFLRGKKVFSKRISGLLTERMADTYRPHMASPAKYEFGFNTESADLYGVMMYHNNRLIKPYVRVGIQLEPNEKGVGVLGVVDADFLKPTHNKQNFDDTKEHRALIRKMAETLQVYWWDKVISKECKETTTTSSKPKRKKVPDVLWVQCEYPKCLKWRTLPPGTDMAKLPKIWYCKFHPNKAIAESNHAYPEETWEDHMLVERTRKRKKEWQAEKSKAKAKQRIEDEEKRLEAAKHLLSTQHKNEQASPEKIVALSNVLPFDGGRGAAEVPAPAVTAPVAQPTPTPLGTNTETEKTGAGAGELRRDNRPLHSAQSHSNDTVIIEEEPAKSNGQSQGQKQLNPLSDITSPHVNIQGGEGDLALSLKERDRLKDQIINMLKEAEEKGVTAGLSRPQIVEAALRKGIDFSLIFAAGSHDNWDQVSLVGSICHLDPRIIKVSPGFYALRKKDTWDLGQKNDKINPTLPALERSSVDVRTQSTDMVKSNIDLQKHTMDLAMMLVHKSMGKSYPQNTTQTNNVEQTSPTVGAKGNSLDEEEQARIASIQHREKMPLVEKHVSTPAEQEFRPPALVGNDAQQNSSPAAANGAIIPNAERDRDKVVSASGQSYHLFDPSPSDKGTVEDKLKLSLFKLKDCLHCLYSLSCKKKNVDQGTFRSNIKHFSQAMTAERHNLININVGQYCKALGLDVDLL